MKQIYIILFLFCAVKSNAQFAPQAEMQGSTAIYKDSTIIINWANNCTVHQGWMNIADTTLGKVSNGTSFEAQGKADGNVVSLGDGGEAIFYFENPIVNGIGADFCVFENGFRNLVDSNLSYMELATISVSNDGINYTLFQPICNLDTTSQIAGAGQYSDCRLVHNLAGKYIANYGTPFDLDDFLPLSSININNIRYIKIKDVVGSINRAICSVDKNQMPINDPYPTDFITGGFDLDALGIIHQQYPTTINNSVLNDTFELFPNPANSIISCKIFDARIKKLVLYNAIGKEINIITQFSSSNIQLNISNYPNGIYFIVCEDENGKIFRKQFTKL